MTRVTKTLLLVALGLALAASALAIPLSGTTSSNGPTPAAALTITLYASFTPPTGWGTTPANISNNLNLTVTQGDVITFHLISNDAPMAHELIIDLDNSHTNNTGDAFSPQFNSTTATSWTYTASRLGRFAFFCGIHGWAAQRGTLVVNAAPAPTPPSGNTLLIVGGVIVVVVIVAVAGAMMMRRKKPKTPNEPKT